MALRLYAVAGAHPGQVRELNEDSVFAYVRPPDRGGPLGLLIVADGMGGHQAGEVASQLAVDTIRQYLAWFLETDENEDTAPTVVAETTSVESGTAPHLQRRLQLAIEAANEAIYQHATENPVEAANMGCTVTCAIVKEDLAIIANVGDSRTYLLRSGQLRQITEDHSYVGQLVREGHLEAEALFEHPQRNVITRALGSQPEVDIDLWTIPLQAGDHLLLCSDGLWEMVQDPAEIVRHIEEADSLKAAVQQLIDAANAYGGVDNISVIVARLDPPTNHDS